ncbi:hypothetical protein [Streptacidiphilus sp. PAMC 29251]
MSDTTTHPGERSVSVAALLAATRSATALSTPPSGPETAEPQREAAEQPSSGHQRRAAAA